MSLLYCSKEFFPKSVIVGYRYCQVWHLTLFGFFQGVSSDLFVVAVVRHPFDHLVSAYFKFKYAKQATIGPGKLNNDIYKYYKQSTE